MSDSESDDPNPMYLWATDDAYGFTKGQSLGEQPKKTPVQTSVFTKICYNPN